MIGCLIFGLALLLAVSCHAQVSPPFAGRGPVAPWAAVPAVVVVGANTNDARLPLVQDAVVFWNRSFAELGSAFRLGPVTEATGTVPIDELRALSDRVLSQAGPTQLPPESIRLVPGDLIVAPFGRGFYLVCHALAKPRQRPGGDQERPALAASPAQRRP